MTTTTLAGRARPVRLDPLLDAPLVGPRVLAFVGPAAVGCNMWRVWQPVAALRLHGYPASWGWLRQRETRLFTGEADAYIFCRACWPRSTWRETEQTIKRWHREGKRVFYECDDDLFTPFSVAQLMSRVAVPGAPPIPTEAQLREEAAWWQWSLAHVDGVTVSTQYLASTVRRFTDAPVEVVPNAIDHEWFVSTQRDVPRPVPGPTIGWAGGNRPDADLAVMAQAWGRIASRFPDVTFVVMGHQPPIIGEHVPEARIHRVPWLDPKEYPRGLVGIDIGCCPLEDRPFNRAKTPIKAWEYALSGAAVVASPTVYGHVIRHAANGHLASTAGEWEHALAYLLERPKDRAAQAENLKRDVLDKWSLRTNYWRWPAAWHRLMGG